MKALERIGGRVRLQGMSACLYLVGGLCLFLYFLSQSQANVLLLLEYGLAFATISSAFAVGAVVVMGSPELRGKIFVN